MTFIFKLKDIMHYITAKFTPAFLPGAKKKYYLHTKYQDELDIHGVASKAGLYGNQYYVVVRTQLSAIGNTLLKNVREMKSDFPVSIYTTVV
jgi:hypothetical protein